MPFMFTPPVAGHDMNPHGLKQSRMMPFIEQNAQRNVQPVAAHQQHAYTHGYAPPPPPESARPIFEPFGPSPPRAYHARDYRAPMLTYRDIQVPAVSVHAYPDAYQQPCYPDQAFLDVQSAKPSAAAVSEALAAWYTDQVLHNLVVPGAFRAGVGGASEEVWGRAGREKREWERLGQKSLDYPQPWGRMGMFPASPPPQVRRRPSTEKHDPWGVTWRSVQGRSATLVHFVHDMITRMSITPVAIVSAVWYLQGLGLHECDDKGGELRALLRKASVNEPEGVEKRVAMLGLLLAGKWLDDNSFLTKSWTEVTAFPVKEIDRLERVCLRDYHHSLFIPARSWTEHLARLHSAIQELHGVHDHLYAIVHTELNEMMAEAITSEDADISSRLPFPELERRVSAEQLPSAGEQAIARDWGSYVRSYTYDMSDADFERNVSRLVDDDDADYSGDSSVELVDGAMEVDSSQGLHFYEDDEEEFLEYDGARPFLNRRHAPQLQRSSSSSSAHSVESRLSPHYRQPSHLTNLPNSSAVSVEDPADTYYHTQNSSPLERMLDATIGTYVEPGVQIVAPPSKSDYLYANQQHWRPQALPVWY